MQISENEIGTSGVVWREQLEIFDSTKIQAFMDSPRRFFYEYVLGWRWAEPNIHLTFGSCWHDAMEHIQLHGYSDESFAEAAQLFLSRFEEAYPNRGEWDFFEPKTPNRAVKALYDYCILHKPDHEQILYTEIAGVLPISLERNRLLHFKQDTIVLQDQGYWSREHKTTKYFSKPWENSWKNKFQVGTYGLAMYTLKDFLQTRFGDHPILGVQINGVAFKAKETDFRRVPILRDEGQMQKFLWEANHWIDQIDWNMESLAESSPADIVMGAFPCNSESCSKYGCPWADFCTAWPNPLQHCEKPPIGYRQEDWDPRHNEDKSQYKLENGELIKK